MVPTTTVPSNQYSSSFGNIVAEVTRALTSADSSRLSYVAKQLKVLRASDAKRRPVKPQRKRTRRPGWVLEAVEQVLSQQTKPMRCIDVHKAVEVLVGEVVSKDSVCWALSHHSIGHNPLFMRVARGRYAHINRIC